MSKIMLLIKNLVSNWYEKKIAALFIFSGLAIISAGFPDVWTSLLYTLINEIFQTELDVPDFISVDYILITITAILGTPLIGVGIWFYKKATTQIDKQTLIRIAHSSIESVDYSNFDVDLDKYSIEQFNITQTEDMVPFDRNNLQHALREQEKTTNKILNRINGNTEVQLSYWGLAHIPLVFLLGYQIANKSNCCFFEWNQNNLKWEKIKERTDNYPPLKISKDDMKQNIYEVNEVVIKIGITYPIKDSDLNGLELNNFNSYYMEIDQPHRNAIICEEQLNDYQKQFRDILDEINKTYPSIKRIHIFYSGQTSLAYRLGSAISMRMDKEVCVYNYLSSSEPKYNWALTLKDGSYSEIKIINGGILSERLE